MNQILEVPPVEFVDKASQLLAKAMDRSSWSLRCEDVELGTDEVANKDGLLPLVMWIAGQSLSKIWGQQDLVFRCDSNALCGVVPEFNRPILPQAVWLHAIHYEVERAATHQDVSLVINEWFNKWNDALAKKSILLLPPKPVAPTNRTQS